VFPSNVGEILRKFAGISYSGISIRCYSHAATLPNFSLAALNSIAMGVRKQVLLALQDAQ
jgi:hypothetical protein